MKILHENKICMLYWRNYVKSGCTVAGLHSTEHVSLQCSLSSYISGWLNVQENLSLTSPYIERTILPPRKHFFSDKTYTCNTHRCKKMQRYTISYISWLKYVSIAKYD